MRTSGTVVENNFINGLVTEASGLNFPEGAFAEADNVVVNTDGSVERRKGIIEELAAAYRTPANLYGGFSVTNEFLWTSVNGVGDYNLLVKQIGNNLEFYLTDSLGRASLYYQGNVSLTTFNTYTAVPELPGTVFCSFAVGNGYLFVVNKYCKPFWVYWTGTSFVATGIDIRIRDFEGVPDGYAVDTQPATLTEAHEYNLLNQGWDFSPEKKPSGTAQAIDHYFATTGKYPSNAEQWWLYKNADNLFDPLLVDRYYTGTSSAPKGHYILDPFNTNRQGQSARITAAITEKNSSIYRPQCVAFYAGRVFFGGVESSGYMGEIYFSQTINNNFNRYGDCYQANDPTSEEQSDLLATDGGVIKILDVGTMYKLLPQQDYMLVFASNGIWAILGTATSPFKANDYSITKISNIVVENPNAILDVFGQAVFWNKDGIWSISGSSGGPSLQSISDKKIKTFLNAIQPDAVQWAKAALDTRNKILYFIYRSDSISAPTQLEKMAYDKLLCLDLNSGAFYPQSLPRFPSLYISGVCAVYNKQLGLMIKFPTMRPVAANDGITSYANYATTGHQDFGFASSVSYIRTGWKLTGEANKRFQNNYVVFYLKQITGAGAFVRGTWDFANDAASNQWSVQQSIYPASDTLRDYTQRRIKIRGNGRALQFRLTSDGDKPFKVAGWSAFVSGNAAA